MCMYVCVSFSVLAEHQAKEFVFYYACETCMRFIMHVKVIEYKIKRNVCFYSLTITIYLLTPPSKYIYINYLNYDYLVLTCCLWFTRFTYTILLFGVFICYTVRLLTIYPLRFSIYWSIYLLHCLLTILLIPNLLLLKFFLFFFEVKERRTKFRN